MNNKNTVTVSSIINVPVEMVWEFWTDPTHIVNWCFATDDWCAPRAENDPRVGGKFTTRMEAKDGSAGFDLNGEYESVELEKFMKYSIGGGRQVEVAFEDMGTKTKVTEVFDPENENPIEMQAAGWQSILDNFKKYAESKITPYE